MSLRGALALALPAALGARLLRSEQVLEGPFGPQAIGTDALYHLRRIALTLQDFPHAPTFDPLLNPPDGSLVPYEPGLDTLLAAITLAVEGAAPSREALTRVCALAIPWIGLLLLPLYAAAARVFFGERAARWALPFLALLPGCVWFAGVGQVDHHVLEPLALGLPLTLLAAAQVRGEEGKARWHLLLVAGIALGGGLLFWRGMVLTSALAAAALGLRLLQRTRQGGLTPGEAGEGAAVLGLAAALAWVVCATQPMFRQGEPTWFVLSRLQPTVMGVLAAGLALAGGAAWVGRSQRWAAGAAAAAGLLPPMLWLGGSEAGARAVGGLAFLSREDTFVKVVAEQLPLLQDEAGAFNLAAALLLYGWPFFLFPGALLLLASRARPRAGALFWIWTLGLVALGLAQRRYAVLLAPIYAVGLGAVLAWIQTWMEEGRARSPRALPLALSALALGPGVAALATDPSPAQPPEALEVFTWLGEHHRARGLAPEVVMAPWELGHHALWLAGLPAVGNPFGVEWFLPGVKASSAFLIGEEPEAAMDDAGARYAVVGFALFNLRTHARLVGAPPDSYAVEEGGEVAPGPAYSRTSLARLYLGDGAGWQGGPAVSGLRLIWESHALERAPGAAGLLGEPPPALKVFERVAGARVRARGEPGARLVGELPLRTPAGRDFVWRDVVTADSEGWATLKVPYPTSPPAHAQVYATAALHLRWEGRDDGAAARSWQTDIDEGQVQRGEVIELSARALP